MNNREGTPEKYKAGLEDGFDFYDISGKYICSKLKEDMAKGFPKANRRPFIMDKGTTKVNVTTDDYILINTNGVKELIIFS